MAEWMVRLKGDKSDLGNLSAHLSQNGLNVIEEEGSYYLKDVNFNSLTDAHEVHQKAVELIATINMVAKFCLGTGVIEVDCVTFINDEGKRYNHSFRVPKTAHLSIRGMVAEFTVTKSNGTIDSSRNRSPFKRYIQIARKDEKVDKALRIFTSSEPIWVKLYKVLEVIEEDLGGEPKLKETQWASAKKIELFKHTANSFLAIGDEARHAKTGPGWHPPKKPMSQSEAESLVQDILNKWLQSKA